MYSTTRRRSPRHTSTTCENHVSQSCSLVAHDMPHDTIPRHVVHDAFHDEKTVPTTYIHDMREPCQSILFTCCPRHAPRHHSTTCCPRYIPRHMVYLTTYPTTSYDPHDMLPRHVAHDTPPRHQLSPRRSPRQCKSSFPHDTPQRHAVHAPTTYPTTFPTMVNRVELVPHDTPQRFGGVVEGCRGARLVSWVVSWSAHVVGNTTMSWAQSGLPMWSQLHTTTVYLNNNNNNWFHINLVYKKLY